jgi:hypothetical protein
VTTECTLRVGARVRYTWPEGTEPREADGKPSPRTMDGTVVEVRDGCVRVFWDTKETSFEDYVGRARMAVIEEAQP